MEPNLGSSSGAARRVTVLGSTGSIGRSALDVIERSHGFLEVLALGAASRAIDLAEQAIRHNPRVVALADAARLPEFRERAAGRWAGEVLVGPRAMEDLARLPEAGVVLNGIVGAAGLLPSRAALRAGKPLALANKESLVIGGELLTQEARVAGLPILPVDSEHSGVFQLIQAAPQRSLRRIVLTASGGPFRERPLSSFASITPEEALCHPTWRMGPRITVDSATLLNKGFEMLEARWLFDLPVERIDVWIHPQSIVHGLVEWVDGSTTAQLSVPDMRIPIQIALCHPERIDSGLPRCDLAEVGRLDFAAPDPRRYPCLGLARRALQEGGTSAAVLNAADERVIEAFLAGALPWPRIHEVLSRVMDARPRGLAGDLESVLEADAWARREAGALLA